MVAEAVEEAVRVGRHSGRGVSVTSELRPEDSLSSGTLMNNSRSTSVWKVESVSTRSPDASTVTVCEAPATWRTRLRLVPTTERISKLWLAGAKPLAETLTR
jgi:hypothetical protein